MKKIGKIIAIITLVILITGCNNKKIEEISYDKFKELIGNKETFVLKVMKDGCPYCEEYKPIFSKVITKNKIVAYELNYSKLSESDEKKFKDEYDVNATPTTLFFIDGEEVFSSRIEGSVPEARLLKTLQRLEYTK